MEPASGHHTCSRSPAGNGVWPAAQSKNATPALCRLLRPQMARGTIKTEQAATMRRNQESRLQALPSGQNSQHRTITRGASTARLDLHNAPRDPRAAEQGTGRRERGRTAPQAGIAPRNGHTCPKTTGSALLQPTIQPVQHVWLEEQHEQRVLSMSLLCVSLL